MLGLVEKMPTPRFAAAAAASVGFPLIAAGAAEGALAYGFGGLAAAMLAFVVGAFVHRRNAARLPLVIAQVVGVGRRDGHPIYRFRVRLGNGRAVRSAHADVRFVPEQGEPVRLDTVDPGGVRVGPWTVLAVDREGRVHGNGRFMVRIEAVERGRVWCIEHPIGTEALRPGWFTEWDRLVDSA